MKNYKTNYTLIILIFLIISCNNDKRSSKDDILDYNLDTILTNNSDTKPKQKNIIKPEKIAKAIFYIENSESMFGYVNGPTDYVDVVSDLSEKPEFVINNTNREFWFVNGGKEIKLNKIGNDPILFKDKLNKQAFRVGNICESNLNLMFQIALEKAKKDTISILLSDGIYSVNGYDDLIKRGKETRSRFIERLTEGDLQTLILKMKSQFVGDYFPITGGRLNMSQNRPYYIWIFGDTDLLNKYFSDEYIKSLKNFQDAARFLKINQFQIPYEITSHNTIGSFRTERNSKNVLSDVKKNRNTKEFQFSIAVDFSDIPLSESYLISRKNYDISNTDYDIVSLEKANGIKLFNLNIKPTHIITLRTNKSPYGDLELSLLNSLPNWIDETNINNEDDIVGDERHTFGFKFLVNGIHAAYDEINQKENIATFKVQLKK